MCNKLCWTVVEILLVFYHHNILHIMGLRNITSWLNKSQHCTKVFFSEAKTLNRHHFSFNIKVFLEQLNDSCEILFCFKKCICKDMKNVHAKTWKMYMQRHEKCTWKDMKNVHAKTWKMYIHWPKKCTCKDLKMYM